MIQKERWYQNAGMLLVLIISLSAAQYSFSQSSEVDACPQTLRYVFSWSQEQSCDFSVRGGSTKGAPLSLDPWPHNGWLALQALGLSNKEKDRLAILAMAGPYRTSFEFLETVGYSADFKRAAPYQSWGTEYVYVVEEREDFISLQHIMVMFIDMGDGQIAGPIVQKHWRQDWQYEKPQIFVYSGDDTWTHQSLAEDEITGSWAQSVYQVDDSPRYEAIGRWDHRSDFSTWLSAETWRPVPRRETSARDDYNVLIGTNRHTILPSGWVQEEENYKVVLADDTVQQYLAKELGVNRYDRIVDFDFSAGDEYWQKTGQFWADTRDVWRELITTSQSHKINTAYDGVPLFAELFDKAEFYGEQDIYESAVVKEELKEILMNYFE